VTIAVSLKVNDGLVLAADSASTILSAYGVENVYNNANKVFNLRKGLPVGLITWGLGGLAGLSISTLAKDLRVRFSGDDPARREWHLDPEAYTLAAVADRVREFFYEEHYKAAAGDYEPTEEDGPYPPLGFISRGSISPVSTCSVVRIARCSVTEVRPARSCCVTSSWALRKLVNAAACASTGRHGRDLASVAARPNPTRDAPPIGRPSPLVAGTSEGPFIHRISRRFLACI
jgi:hypothetical protein